MRRKKNIRAVPTLAVNIFNLNIFNKNTITRFQEMYLFMENAIFSPFIGSKIYGKYLSIFITQKISMSQL